MRGPVEGGDKVIIASVADASPISYPLARIPNNVSYETVSEQPEAEPNQPLAWPLSFHGGLAYSKYDPATAGVYVMTDNGMIVYEPGIIAVPAVLTTVTLTGAANPPQYFFETAVNDSGADDGQPVLYAIAPEAAEINVYKISMDSGDFGTLLNTKTFAVTPTQPMGRPVKWNDGSNTRWLLGLGDNGFIQRLDSVVSGTSADTWTGGDADARHLKVVGNQLMRSTDENQVSLLARGVSALTEANWASDFFVGDVSSNITELGEAGEFSYIAKEDGFYQWDLEGEAVNVFPEIGNAPRNGQGMVYWHGGFPIPAASGLWWTRTGKPVGPDSNPNNRSSHPSLGDNRYVKHGRWMGLTPSGQYIYALYVTSVGNVAQILWGRERESGDPPGWGPIIWHSLAAVTADFDDFHGAFVTELSEFSSTETRPFVWVASGNDVAYLGLDKDGAPAQRRGNVNLESIAQVVSGDWDFGLPRVTKQLRVIEGWAEDIPATGTPKFQFVVFRDGGSGENVGSAITTNGFFQRFWTQDTNDIARSMLVRCGWTTLGFETDTNGPYLRDVMVRAVALPDTTRDWTFLFAVEDNGKTAKKIRSELEGYVGDLKKFTLPDRDVFNGVMGKIRMLRADEINRLTPRNQEPPHYIISAVVREMSGS